MTLSEMLSLALIVAMISIFGFFSDEFMRFFRRYFDYFLIKLLVPLIIVSYLVIINLLWISDWILFFQAQWDAFVRWLVIKLPFQYGAYLCAVFLFAFLSGLIPQLIIYIQKSKKRSVSRLNYWLPRIGAFFWITVMMFYWVL